MSDEMKFMDVQVRIPNLEGDGVAEIKVISVPVTIDPHTGEELLTAEAVELIENTKARYMGLLLPNQILALRKRLGLTQKQMSDLIQAGEKSYTRWETGRARPSRMVNVLLRLLDEGKVSVNDLLSQQKCKSDTQVHEDSGRVQSLVIFPETKSDESELIANANQKLSKIYKTWLENTMSEWTKDLACAAKEHEMEVSPIVREPTKIESESTSLNWRAQHRQNKPTENENEYFTTSA